MTVAAPPDTHAITPRGSSESPESVTAQIRSIVLAQGALTCGFAVATRVDDAVARLYTRWIDAGSHASMDYLARNCDVRFDPRLLLPGARTVISCAFSYFCDSTPSLPVAMYALGRDYHKVLRKRLKRAAALIVSRFGGEARVCVDTAPLLERYWAQKAAVGFIGLNHQLIVPGAGSYVFLGEILWTGSTVPSTPLNIDCGACGRCLRACPTAALHGSPVPAHLCSGSCLSYLTIEHRGDFPPGVNLHGRFYGCDLCQSVCPHNSAPAPASLTEFSPLPTTLALSPERLAILTDSLYAADFCHSAIRRCSLQALRRNLSYLK